MDGFRVLLTGDYWHRDFQEIVKDFEIPLTLVPFSQISHLNPSQDSFDLVVVAQSRRGQLTESVVDHLLDEFPTTPIISLLGSWCEGETRSGEPFAGLIRVYWHQWRGRYENFVNQLQQNSLAQWNLPRTATVADHVIKQPERTFPRSRDVVGVSTWSRNSFELYSDALDSIGYPSVWLDMDAGESTLFAILIDGNSLTEKMKRRISDVQNRYGDLPKLLTLNFPRRDEVEMARRIGIQSVISKPFELTDLKIALNRIDSQMPVAST